MDKYNSIKEFDIPTMSAKEEAAVKEYLLKRDITNDEYSPENYTFPKTGEPTSDQPMTCTITGEEVILNPAGRPNGLV